VVLDRNDRPICVVEVKRHWGRATCFRDFDRVRDLILRFGNQHGGSLNRGFLAFTIVKRALGNQTGRVRMMEQAEEIRTIVNERFQREGLGLKCKMGKTRNYPMEYQEVWEEPN